MALKPLDVICRRTRIGFLDDDAMYNVAPEVIKIFAKEFKWNTEKENQVKKETDDYIKSLNF